jgi:hypothetical protein
MNERHIAIMVVLVLVLLLPACAGEEEPEDPLPSDLDQMPLVLAQPYFQAGYELADYHELDADGDGVEEALAVLTLKLPVAESHLGDTHILTFGRQGGSWGLVTNQLLDGSNASTQLRDLTGDGFPELLVLTEQADTQLGDFVTPVHYTDYLSVFAWTPGSYLVELGTFSSSLSGVLRPRSAVGDWGGQPAIQTVRDLPPVGGPLLWPFYVETFAWDGQGFASVETQERRRISPIISWAVRRNAPWTAAFLAAGGVLGLAVTVIARRSHLREWWVIAGLALVFTVGGIGLGFVSEWLCVPAPILIGLAGLGGGRQIAAWLSKES